MLTRLRLVRGLPWTLAAVAVASVVGAHRLASVSSAHAGSAPRTGPVVPVLVELFTSEGCSSCPPAEDELSRLDREQPIPGVRVIAIGFHVDYWDRLGWTDPFSSSAWTARQQDYDRATGRVYTPQAIVAGREDVVGSDGSKLHALVRDAASNPAAQVDVALSPDGAAPRGVRVAVHVAGLPAVAPGDQADVRVVLVEKGLAVDVPRGENSGKHLQHAPVARDLKSAGVVSASGGDFDATFALPPASHRENLSVVAIVQERGSHHVLGVGTLAL